MIDTWHICLHWYIFPSKCACEACFLILLGQGKIPVPGYVHETHPTPSPTPTPCDDWENIHFVLLSSSNRKYELLSIVEVFRSWNNGMRCMSLYLYGKFIFLSNFQYTDFQHTYLYMTRLAHWHGLHSIVQPSRRSPNTDNSNELSSYLIYPSHHLPRTVMFKCYISSKNKKSGIQMLSMPVTMACC